MTICGALGVEFRRQEAVAECHRRALGDVGLEHRKVEIAEIDLALHRREIS
jgi:hypothetical protein